MFNWTFQILPDDISEREGYIVRNRDYEKSTTKRFLLQQQRSPNTIHRYIRVARLETAPALMPFVLKESDIWTHTLSSCSGFGIYAAWW